MKPEEPGKETQMSVRLTPPLSPEGIAEVIAELEAPPADTPERRAAFELARKARFLVDQVLGETKRRR